MVVFPNAKINLGLDIVSKRNDGYHNISSCFYPIPYSDILEIVPSKELQFNSTGIPIPGDTEDNLCLKAFHLIRQDYSIPNVNIHLHKIVPIGAGLGGGSADASFTLKCLDELFELNIDSEQLESYAGKIGSDCPFFIKNNPIIAEGTGNVFTSTSMTLKGKYLVLFYPEIHIGTSEAYEGVVPSPPDEKINFILEGDISSWQDRLKNDFENSIFPSYPQIKILKESLIEAGALYASMTGSGSAVYGIFDKKPTLSTKTHLVWEGYLEA